MVDSLESEEGWKSGLLGEAEGLESGLLGEAEGLKSGLLGEQDCTRRSDGQTSCSGIRADHAGGKEAFAAVRRRESAS